MRVSLAFVEHRVNIWLRFGRPSSTVILDRWRSVAVFEPRQLCCRVRWHGNHFGTALWSVVVMQAPSPTDSMQRLSGVTPGARILLRADGERAVKSVLDLVDEIEADGFDPCMAPAMYWQVVGNRLAARAPLPRYSAERHAAYVSSGELG